MMRSRLVVLFLILAATAAAQYTSGIEGTVADQSGAAIANAAVLVTNEATQVARETATNATGYFRVPDLPPGVYRVQIRQTGFQVWAQAGIQIDANQLRTVYPKLLIGEQKAEIEVTAAAEAIETGKSSVAASIAQKTIEEAPMLGRNVYAGVAFIAPGVTGAGKLFGGATGSGSAGQDSFQTEPGFQINSAGQRQENNEYQVDGSSVNGNSRDGISNLTPEPDVIQEVRVAAAAFNAERGHNSGALVEVYTKSGTNQIHGTLSEFHTNNQLTSRTVFQSTTNVPVFRRNEYGGTIGGPIVKDRTFIFGGLHHLSSSASQTDVVAAETPQFVAYMQQYFPNNVSTRILAVAPIGSAPVSGFVTANTLRASARYPVPASLPGDLPVLGTSYVNQSLSRPAGQWNTRLDQYFRGYKDRVFFNYFNYFSKAQSANPRPLQRITQPNYGMYGKVNWTRTITPSLLNEASMTLVRVDGATPPTTHPELPSVSVTGMQGFSQSQINWAHVNYNWHDVMSWLQSNHTFKFGFDMDRQHDLDNFTPSYARPSFSFGNVLDFMQDLPLTQTQPVVDLRTGQIGQNIYTRIHITYMGLFAQDDWKVRPNLTVNFGMRYENYFHMAQMDRGGTPGSFFAPGSGSTWNEQVTNGKMRVTGDGLASTNVPQGIMPRAGFGWDVFGNGSLAIRGGWGMYYNRIGNLSYAGTARVNPPFGTVSFDIRNGQQLNFTLGSSNGLFFPLPPGVQFTQNPAGGLTGTPIQVSGFMPEMKVPVVQVWNLTVSKRLTNSIVVEADYIGNHGYNLYLQANVNRYAGDLIQHNGSLTRLSPYFGNVVFGRPMGYSDGHYGTVLISKRFGKGLSAKGIYAFGKATDLTSSNDNGVGGGQNVLDAANPGIQHARSDFNVARRLTIDSVYEIPSLIKDGFGKHITGGWQLAGVAIFQSGLPFSVVTTAPYPRGDFNADGFNWDIPNTPSFGNHISAARGDFIKGLFPASAFPLPTGGVEGSLGRNTFDGPGLANVNLNVVKTAHIPWFVREGATLQLRGEMFNLLNRVNLTNVVNDLSNSLFGRSTAQSLPRSVTLGIRISF